MERSHRGTPLPNVIALFAALFGLAAVLFVGHYIAKTTAAQRWPTTMATVIESRILEVEISENESGPQSQVRYRYYVNDKPFECDLLRYSMSQFGGTAHYYPTQAAAQHPVGAAIRISYNPADPADAVSDPSQSRSAYPTFIVGLVLSVGGIWYLLTRGKRNLRAQESRLPVRT